MLRYFFCIARRCIYSGTHGSSSKRQLTQDLLGGSGDMLLTEMKDDELLKLVALDLHTASEE